MEFNSAIANSDQRSRTTSSFDQSTERAHFGSMKVIGERLAPDRSAKAKRSFVTRRINIEEACFLARPMIAPRSGDLALAKVTSIGQHARLELIDGRRAHLHIGDEIIVAFGERYAADQFHSILPDDLSSCDLVAAGGIASRVIEKNSKMNAATTISPLGLLADELGEPLNLSRAALHDPGSTDAGNKAPQIIAVVGSCMNAGKTTTAANIVHAFVKIGVKVAAYKATGTGAGGDMWRLLDAGAEPVFDFTDAGLASTYNVAPARIEAALTTLISCLSQSGAEIIVIEVADGLLQNETQTLVQSDFFRARVDSIVYAAGDAISAAAGVQILESWGHSPKAISGALTSSPLAVAEAKKITRMPVLTNNDFREGGSALISLLQSAAAAGAKP